MKSEVEGTVAVFDAEVSAPITTLCNLYSKSLVVLRYFNYYRQILLSGQEFKLTHLTQLLTLMAMLSIACLFFLVATSRGAFIVCSHQHYLNG